MFNHICKQGNKTELNVESSGQAGGIFDKFQGVGIGTKNCLDYLIYLRIETSTENRTRKPHF